ncbi:hypothetical protein D3C87_1175990 [compost metagenome]
MAGQRAQRGVQPGVGVRGHGQPIGNQAGGLLLRGGEANHAEAARAVLEHRDLAQRLGFLARGGGQQVFHGGRGAQRGGDAEHVALAAVGNLPDGFQRGGGLGDLHRHGRRVGQHHPRVPDQRHHGGGAVQHVAAVARAVAADGPGHAGVPRRQGVVLGHPGQRDRAGLAPAARAVGLLQRFHRAQDPIGIHSQRPQQAPPPALGGGIRAGQGCQFAQGVLPAVIVIGGGRERGQGQRRAMGAGRDRNGDCSPPARPRPRWHIRARGLQWRPCDISGAEGDNHVDGGSRRQDLDGRQAD